MISSGGVSLGQVPTSVHMHITLSSLEPHQVRTLETNLEKLGSPALQIFISLVVNSRCWTADRLAKRGLPHPVACPLCDQAEETIQHTIISCVFARQVWTLIFQRLGLIAIVPQPTAAQFSAWWSNAISRVPKVLREGLNSLIILIPWELWKHRNDCV